MKYHTIPKSEKENKRRTFCNLLGLDPGQHRKVIDDPYMTELEKVHKETRDIKMERPDIGAISITLVRVLYGVTRATKPDLVVETGVARGASTAAILAAMRRNGIGHLHSVDTLSDVGILVNDDLKERWTFHIGKSQFILPTLGLKNIDIFIHDSQHTYDTMTFEYEWAYPRLRDGGLLMSHDIHMTDAFIDFADRVGEEWYCLRSSHREFVEGVIIKGPEDSKEAEQVNVEEWFKPPTG